MHLVSSFLFPLSSLRLTKLAFNSVEFMAKALIVRLDFTHCSGLPQFVTYCTYTMFTPTSPNFSPNADLANSRGLWRFHRADYPSKQADRRAGAKAIFSRLSIGHEPPLIGKRSASNPIFTRTPKTPIGAEKTGTPFPRRRTRTTATRLTKIPMSRSHHDS